MKFSLINQALNTAYIWITARKNTRSVSLLHYSDRLEIRYTKTVAGITREIVKVFTDVDQCLAYAFKTFKLVL